MEKNHEVSRVGIALIAFLVAFCALIGVALFKTVTTPYVGIVVVVAMLFIIAWAIEMLLPDEMFVKLIFVMGGLGTLSFIVMHALKMLHNDLFLSLWIYVTIASIIQVIFSPIPSSSEDS